MRHNAPTPGLGLGRRLLMLLLAAGLSGCGHLIPAQHQSLDPGDLRPGAYTLDPDHKAVLFKIDHLGFSPFVGRFNRVEATLDFDPARPEASRLDVVVDVASVDTGLPAFDETLRGPGWFDTARHPTARFRSTAVEQTGPASGRVTGAFTLAGVTQPLTLDVTFHGGADNPLTGRFTLGFSASGSFDRTAHGVDALAPAIGAQVMLEIHGEFLATASP